MKEKKKRTSEYIPLYIQQEVKKGLHPECTSLELLKCVKNRVKHDIQERIRRGGYPKFKLEKFPKGEVDKWDIRLSYISPPATKAPAEEPTKIVERPMPGSYAVIPGKAGTELADTWQLGKYPIHQDS